MESKSKFLYSDSTFWRLMRTVVESVLSVLVDYVVVIVAEVPIPNEFRPAICTLMVAIFTAIISEIRKANGEPPIEVKTDEHI